MQCSIHLWVAEGFCACSPGIESREIFWDTSQFRCWSCFWKGKLGSSSSTKLRWEITFKTKITTGSKQTIGNMLQVAVLGALLSFFNTCGWERTFRHKCLNNSVILYGGGRSLLHPAWWFPPVANHHWLLWLGDDLKAKELLSWAYSAVACRAIVRDTSRKQSAGTWTTWFQVWWERRQFFQQVHFNIYCSGLAHLKVF